MSKTLLLFITSGSYEKKILKNEFAFFEIDVELNDPRKEVRFNNHSIFV